MALEPLLPTQVSLASIYLHATLACRYHHAAFFPGHEGNIKWVLDSAGLEWNQRITWRFSWRFRASPHSWIVINRWDLFYLSEKGPEEGQERDVGVGFGLSKTSEAPSENKRLLTQIAAGEGHCQEGLLSVHPWTCSTQNPASPWGTWCDLTGRLGWPVFTASFQHKYLMILFHNTEVHWVRKSLYYLLKKKQNQKNSNKKTFFFFYVFPRNFPIQDIVVFCKRII